MRVDVPVLHGLRGLGVESARELVAVGVEGDVHAARAHHRACPRNRIHHLHLVGPPVAEAARTRAVRRNLVSHLVALEHMLKRADGESHLLGQVEQHHDLILPVAVAVHESLALEDLGERLKLDVVPRRHLLVALSSGQRLVARLRLAPGACRVERVAHVRLNAHASVRVAVRRSCHVLAERELDARRGVRHVHLGHRGAPLDLRDGVLAADRVRAAVKLVDARDAAGELPVPADVIGIQHVLDAHLRGVGLRELVDAAVDACVAVAIDDAGRDVTALAVHDDRAGWGRQRRSDGRDLAALHQHIGALENACARRCPHRGIPEVHILRDGPGHPARIGEGIHGRDLGELARTLGRIVGRSLGGVVTLGLRVLRRTLARNGDRRGCAGRSDIAL